MDMFVNVYYIRCIQIVLYTAVQRKIQYYCSAFGKVPKVLFSFVNPGSNSGSCFMNHLSIIKWKLKIVKKLSIEK